MKLEEKLIYQYFSTTDNKIYKKSCQFALINFLIKLLKYRPLSSKFLKLSNDAPAGLKKIIFLINSFFLISMNILCKISFNVLKLLRMILLPRHFLKSLW